MTDDRRPRRLRALAVLFLKLGIIALAAAALALRFKVGAAWLVVGGALAGWVLGA